MIIKHARVAVAAYSRLCAPRRATLVTTATLQSEDCASATRGVNRILEDGINTRTYITKHYNVRYADCRTTACPMPSDFSLADKVALVSGGHRGLGLEGALALAEAGARAVYCVDINNAPDAEWTRVQQYVSRLRGPDGEARRLEYICGDTRDQVSFLRVVSTSVVHCLHIVHCVPSRSGCGKSGRRSETGKVAWTFASLQQGSQAK